MAVQTRTGRPAFEGPVGFVEKEGRVPTSVLRSMHQVLTQVAALVSGRLGLGDGTHGSHSGRIDGQWLRTKTPPAPNTTFAVPHGLGRIPVGSAVYAKSAACDVYTAPTRDHDEQQLWLRATVADVDILLHVV